MRESSTDLRSGLRDARRIVVKIGSRSITDSEDSIAQLATAVRAQRDQGRTVVVVSSGAVALGFRRLGLVRRPRSIAKLQASAAAGQSKLMQAFEHAFGAEGMVVAQVLLTHVDLSERDRYLNARAAVEALLELGAIPVINENDTVAVEEIRFGDNDQLAAMVATLVGADLLVLLTHVEGLLDAQGNRVGVVRDVTEVAELVRETTDAVGTGGMRSKLDAARRATRRGVPVVIGDARDPAVLAAIVDGQDAGTLFLPHGAKLASRKHWIAFTLKPKGAVIVDDGAAHALRQGKSLLPAGVLGVRGDFDTGDAVRILSVHGGELARGLARYGTRDVARLAGARSSEIESRLGRFGGEEIVHRDDMVVE